MAIIQETLLTALIMGGFGANVESPTQFNSYIVESPSIVRSSFISPNETDLSIRSLLIGQNLFEKTEVELNSYLNLEENWDGYQGIAPMQDHIDNSIAYLRFIKSEDLPAPKSMLSGDGEVSLYWDSNDTHIEISFEDNMLVSYLVSSADIVIGEDDIEIHSEGSYSIPSSIHAKLIDISRAVPSLLA